MSWLWKSPGEEESSKPAAKPHSADELSYSNVFTADDARTSAPADNASSLGSAFSDVDAFTTSSDSFFPAASNAPGASFLPPPELPGTTGGPRVNFDAMGSIDAGTVAPAFGIYNVPSSLSSSDRVDYVFSDDYAEVRKKSVSEQLIYLTGSAYLSGAAVGGGIGLAQGIRASAGKTTKLRLNAVLNSMAKRGVAASNSLAVLALMFSIAESSVYHYTNDDTALNYAAAGAATGALFKCTRGVRVAGIWAVAGAATALATIYATRRGSYGRGLQGLL